MEAKMYQVIFLRKNGTRREIRTIASNEIEAMTFALKWTKTPIREIQELTSEELKYEKGQELLEIKDALDDTERKQKISKIEGQKNEKHQLEKNPEPTDHDLNGGGGDARDGGGDGMHVNAPSSTKRNKREDTKG